MFKGIHSCNVHNEKGSVTVEACIITPIVFLIVSVLIYMSLIFIQKIILQNALNSGIRKAEEVILGTGEQDLYWRFYDRKKDAKIEAIRGATHDYLNKNSLLNRKETVVDVDIENFILYKTIKIRIKSSFYLPAGRLLFLFGLSQHLQMQTEKSVVITEPVEFIRNTDFALDTYEQVKKAFPQLEAIDGKVREVIDAVFDRIQDVFR